MNRLAFFLLFSLTVQFCIGQKVGYVDTDYILEKLPEYAEAQKQLDAISAEWQAQIIKKIPDHRWHVQRLSSGRNPAYR